MTKYLILITASIILFSCTPEPLNIELENQFGQLPRTIIYPSNNQPSLEKKELGRLLFWDPILSGNKDVACVSCHHPEHGYAEQLELSIGVGGVGLSKDRKNGTLIKRNAPTIINVAYNGILPGKTYIPDAAPMFWDNRVLSLENQAIQPILSKEEMRGSSIAEDAIIDTILHRLNAIPEYKLRFQEVFGEDGITEENVGKAIANFERSLVANNSRFDQYANGDMNALTALELRGMINFTEVGCANCHNGPMFSNFELHVLTVPENQKLETPDKGNGDFAFRTPTLRNLDFTAPYMHNGVFNSLDEVMAFYDDVDDESQNPNVSSQNKDKKLGDLNIPDDKVASIIAFLKSLNDENFDDTILTEVPSKLQAGGNIQ